MLNLVWIKEHCLCIYIHLLFIADTEVVAGPKGSVYEVPYCINLFDVEIQGLQCQGFLLQAGFALSFMNVLVFLVL